MVVSDMEYLLLHAIETENRKLNFYLCYAEKKGRVRKTWEMKGVGPTNKKQQLND